jgi:hypothetical protein
MKMDQLGSISITKKAEENAAHKAPILSPSSIGSAAGGRQNVRCRIRDTRSAVLSLGNMLGFHTEDGIWCRPHDTASLVYERWQQRSISMTHLAARPIIIQPSWYLAFEYL